MSEDFPQLGKGESLHLAQDAIASMSAEARAKTMRDAISSLAANGLTAPVRLTESILIVRGQVDGPLATSPTFQDRLLTIDELGPHWFDLFRIREIIRESRGAGFAMIGGASHLGFDIAFVEDGEDWGFKFFDRRRDSPIKEIMSGGTTVWQKFSEPSGWAYTTPGPPPTGEQEVNDGA